MKNLCILIFFALPFISYSQVVDIPDPAFKQHLIDIGVDSNVDGEIQEIEAESVESLSLSAIGMSDLSGIEAFSNLRFLDCNGNEIVQVNMSDLKSVDTLILSHNAIQKLEVVGENDLRYLDIGQNPLKELDIAEESKIEVLRAEDIETAHIRLSNLQFLHEFFYSGYYDYRDNKDTVILENLPRLTSLNLDYDMYKLELRNLPSLVSMENLSTEVIDIHDCAKMVEINVISMGYDDDSAVRLSSLPSLKTLVLEGEFAQILADFNSFKQLEWLSLAGSDQGISKLHLRDLDQLEWVDLDIMENLDTLILENLPSLEVLDDLSYLNTSLLHLKNLPKLKLSRSRPDLYSEMPYGLLSVRLENLPLVDSVGFLFDLINGNMTEFALKHMPSLEHLYIDRYYAPILDLRALSSLEKLELSVESPADGGDQRVFLRNGKNTEINLDHYDPNHLRICGDSLELEQINLQIGQQLDQLHLSTDCSIIPGSGYYLFHGRVIADIDNDGCDLGDRGLKDAHIIYSNKDEDGRVLSGSYGEFATYIKEGVSRISLRQDLDYYSWDLDSLKLELPRDTQLLEYDFCLSPAGEINDLRIKVIPVDPLRPGFEADLILNYQNVGSTVQSGEVEFLYNDLYLDYIDGDPEGIVEQDKLTWSYEELQPLEEQSIRLRFRFNSPMDTPPLEGDDSVRLEAIIYPIMGDAAPANNRHIIEPILVNSYDPNDKTCMQGEEMTPENVGEELDYRIRFENTGTAEAVNVVVGDRIDTTSFDINSLRVTASSHDMETRISDGNLVEFIFEDIYLPFDDANNDGYVTFSIRTKDDLSLGDTLANTAEIYFDFNWPIITNTAIMEVREPVHLVENSENVSIDLIPNPVKDRVSVRSSNMIKTITLIDGIGRAVRSIQYKTPVYSAQIDMKNLQVGHYFLELRHIDGSTNSLKIIKD